jgi:hypothetical protein
MIEILNNYLINDISLIVNEYYKPATFLQIFDYIKNKSNITKILDLTAKNLEENNYNYKIVNTIYDIINDEKVYLINLTFENIYDFNNPKCKNIIYFGSLKYIDSLWLYNNQYIEDVSFNFYKLKYIYTLWMTNCSNLKKVDFNLPKLEYVYEKNIEYKNLIKL